LETNFVGNEYRGQETTPEDDFFVMNKGPKPIDPHGGNS